jgi:hypothetical protein
VQENFVIFFSLNVEEEPSMNGTENYLHTTKDWVAQCSNPDRGNIFFSSLKGPDRLWGPKSLLLNWYH